MKPAPHGTLQLGLSVLLGAACSLGATSSAFADDDVTATTPTPAPSGPMITVEPSAPDPAATSAPIAKDAPAPRCNDKEMSVCSDDQKKEPVTFGMVFAGIRPSLTHVTGGGTGTNDVGAAFAGMVDSYALDGHMHGSLAWVLGGGAAGFEGMFAGSLDAGRRFDVTRNQGPVVRLGLDGRMQGNDDYYFSTIELPRGIVGYQYLKGRVMLEAGARGGPILGGRFNPGEDGYRSLSGSLEIGGYLSAQTEHLKLDATGMHIDAWHTGDGTAVDIGRGDLCVLSHHAAVCADLALIRGDAENANRTASYRAVATYTGVTVGVASW